MAPHKGEKNFQDTPSKQDLGTDRLGDLFTIFYWDLRLPTYASF